LKSDQGNFHILYDYRAEYKLANGKFIEEGVEFDFDGYERTEVTFAENEIINDLHYFYSNEEDGEHGILILTN
jgi:hypothetical protein